MALVRPSCLLIAILPLGACANGKGSDAARDFDAAVSIDSSARDVDSEDVADASLAPDVLDGGAFDATDGDAGSVPNWTALASYLEGLYDTNLNLCAHAPGSTEN